MPETIRVGIIGLEGHYSDITGAAKAFPNLQVTAMADHRPEVLRRAAAQRAFAKATAWPDYREMLSAEKLDLVGVCGENGGRAAVIQACAKRGLPIIAEKPIALSLSELAAVRRVVLREGVRLTMLLTMRFVPHYQAMRDLVNRGEIGEVISIGAQKSYKLGTRPAWMKTRKSYGGTIPYIGIHMVDLMRWISGREFKEAGAYHGTVAAPDLREMENTAGMIFRLDNGGTASLRLDYLRPESAPTHGDDRLRLAGTRGVVEYQEKEGLTLISEGRPPAQIKALPEVKSLSADFLESLYSGTEHLLSLADIFRVSEIVLKTRASADEHRFVHL